MKGNRDGRDRMSMLHALLREYHRVDKYIVRWLGEYGILSLRFSLAIVFIWFGMLKVIGGSPAIELVKATVYWVDSSWFVPFLGWWEVIIGVCFLWTPLLRLGIGLMMVQMVGTFLPLVLLPSVVYEGNFLRLTMEGQYIVKNIVLIASALVVGGSVRRK